MPSRHEALAHRLRRNIMPRARLRDHGPTIGRIPTGKHNAITDVAGTLVGPPPSFTMIPASPGQGSQ